MTPTTYKGLPISRQHERFGDNVRRTRQARRLSQESLAEHAHLHRTLVGLFERGETKCYLTTLLKLAGALEVRVEDLLEGIVWQPGTGGFLVADPPELPRHRPPGL